MANDNSKSKNHSHLQDEPSKDQNSGMRNQLINDYSKSDRSRSKAVEDESKNFESVHSGDLSKS